MTSRSALHVFAPGPAIAAPSCGVFKNAVGIASQFSDFDVSETGTGMPCYCIQWNVSDKISGGFFQAELREVRSSHDPLTATATHELYYNLQDSTGKVVYTHEQQIGILRTDAQPFHPFGTPFQDTVAFYMNQYTGGFTNPIYWRKIVTFFWYNFVQGGTKANPHPAEIIGTGQALIPNWFNPTDLSLEFVGIEGDVQFAKELKAIVSLGETVGTVGLTSVTSSLAPSPCASKYGVQTSNSEQTPILPMDRPQAQSASVHV